MGISVFISYPKPFTSAQEQFAERVVAYLAARGLDARTLGVTDYDMDVPLKAIRRLMLESNGLITIAFRRAHIIEGQGKPNTQDSFPLDDRWLTSPWSHIEPAMAYQIGLPIVILRERGVMADGVLEKGIVGNYMPEFDLDDPTSNYLETPEWNQIIAKWEGQVRTVVDAKGSPPRLF